MPRTLKSAFLRNPRKVLPQVLATVVAAIGYMGTGLVRGWASPGIPSLAESQLFNVTASDKGWIASVAPIGAFCGSLIAGPLLQYLGRRLTLIIITVPFCVGFLVLGFASYGTSIATVYAGRIISSLANGATTPSSQIYISEMSSPHIRGALGSITALWLSLGILIAYIIGAFTPWYVSAWIESLFPAFLGIGMFFLPETPGWLITKGREEEARNSLQRMRGPHTDISAEFERIRANALNMNTTEKLKPSDILKPHVLKPFGLTLALMWFQQFSGINAVIFYTVTIFKEAGGSVKSHIATIIVGLVQFFATFLSISLVDKAGRRILLITSALIMALALAGMGTFFYIKAKQGEEAAAALGWLPLSSLVIFILAFSIGFNNIPFLIMGEILPARFRSVLGPISSSFNLSMTFTVVRTFPIMSESIGTYGAFWLFMTSCICASVFVFFFLPETKGKSLEEIERMFKGPEVEVASGKEAVTPHRLKEGVHEFDEEEDEDEDDGRLAPSVA